MLKIRRSRDHLIFMGIPILVRWHLYIETAPRFTVFPILVWTCPITPMLLKHVLSELKFGGRLSFPGMGIPMLKIRWWQDCLTFNMGIPILVRWHLYIETAPRFTVFPVLVWTCPITSMLLKHVLWKPKFGGNFYFHPNQIYDTLMSTFLQRSWWHGCCDMRRNLTHWGWDKITANS